jgi:hypothetical protein
MKNAQLKDQFCPSRADLQNPIFSWRKTALIGDEFYIWWLYYEIGVFGTLYELRWVDIIVIFAKPHSFWCL